MPDPQSVGLTLSLGTAERHDRICDRFEAGWQAGSPPSIESLLLEVPEAERGILFVALLRVELDHRPGHRNAADELKARFPDFAALIESVFRDPAETQWFLGTGDEEVWEPPPIVGYELGGRLGQGGMGVVVRGRHVGLDRPVAIKFIKAGALGRPDYLVRFHLEARTVAGLNHPNVVALYDYGQVDGVPYFVMEFVAGGSLADRLSGVPADPDWAAGVVEQLAGAIHYVHGHDLIHRDLKPANVLLVADGTPKVTDFGLAKRLAGGDPGLTATDTVLGSACYMSPEQARGEVKSIGRSTDIYGLGAILYECLTGRPPFLADSYAATVAQVLTEEPIRPSDRVAGLPADLEAVCLKCLEKDPTRRYASAAELAADLACCRARQPPSARAITQLERHARWARRAAFELGDLVRESVGVFTYRAHQAVIGRSVFLKLSSGAAGSPAHAALRREAEALAGLDFPNVLRMYDYSEQFGQPYLVLEDPEGGRPIGDRPAAKTKERWAAELGLKLAVGLQTVHGSGVLHGGLWPKAVVLTRDETVKIGDFGAARRIGDSGGAAPDWVPPNYLAPEVHAGAWSRVGPAADLYSVGAIIHELLWGELPGASPRRGAVAELDAIVETCLAPDPAKRYQTAGALSHALQVYLVPPRPPGGDSSLGEGTIVPDDAPAIDRSTRYRLRVTRGPKLAGRTYELSRARLIIGRSKENDVRLTGAHISRAHCGVVWNHDAGCHEVVDFGSYNGTFVNAERVRDRRQLSPGDRIVVADYELVFEPLAVNPDLSRDV
jgi:eukaryotic-like serine/threonine-protein kinase